MSSATPYQYEPSWFAALRYVTMNCSASAGPEGFVFRDPFVTDKQPKIPWAYMDGAVDRAANGEALRTFIGRASTLIAANGYLIISCAPEAHVFVDEALALLPTWKMVERSFISGRDFYVMWNNSTDEHPPFPEAIVWRDGDAIGDHILAMAVAEHYTKIGFATVLMGRQPMRFVSQHNPHVPYYTPIPVMQDWAMIHRFTDFWVRRVRVFVNLDWSIEGHLLKKEIQNGFLWSDLQRRAVCGKSYYANAAELSGIGEMPTITWYCSEAENKEAHEVVAGMGDFVYIQIAGSGDVHKWYPWWGEVINQIFASTKLSVYMAFGPNQYSLACKIRDHVVRNYGNIMGRLFMNVPRRSFGANVAIARNAVCVATVETGINMALAHDPVRKVLLLSHSAASNFEGQQNTACIEPKVPCHPCHRIHANFTFCHEDKQTGASICQAYKEPQVIVDAILASADFNTQPLIAAAKAREEKAAEFSEKMYGEEKCS